jgi:hypothetical protein
MTVMHLAEAAVDVGFADRNGHGSIPGKRTATVVKAGQRVKVC